MSSFVWTQLLPATQPGLFGYCAMAPDHINGTLVEAGGGSSTNQQHGWSFNVSIPSWTDNGLVYTTGTGGRRTLCWDDANNNIVAFGGTGPGSLNETWTWNGTTWTHLSPATSPPARFNCAMAYSPASGAVIMSGGGGGSFTDTWKWDGTTWTQLFPATTPSNFTTGTLCALGNDLYIIDPSGFAKTWKWDGTNWSDVTPGSQPSNRSLYYMVSYPPTSQIIMWGGFNAGTTISDTTVYGFDGSAWSAQTISGSAPPVGSQGAIGLDPASGTKIILKDAVTSGSSWTQTWQLAGPAAAAASKFYAQII